MVRLYFDHHIHQVVTRRLRSLGIDVLTAIEDGHAKASDDVLLDRSTQLVV